MWIVDSVAGLTDQLGGTLVFGTMSQNKLYSIPGSHPAMSIAMMLDYKGIPYKRVDLLPVVSKAILRLNGFSGVTVPACKINGQKLQGSRPIARALDLIEAEPHLLPDDPAQRTGALEAERIGDEELQHPVRQIIWWLLKRNGSAMASYLEGSHTGIPIPIATRTAAPLVAGSVHFNKANDENVKAAIIALPGILDRLDSLISEGAIGNEEPNAGDFQVAPSIALALTMDDLRPAIENRPIGKLAEKLVPDYAGHLPPGLPDEWLAPLRG